MPPAPTVAVDATPLLGRPTGVGAVVRGALGAVAAQPAPPRLVGYGLTGRAWRALPGVLPAGVTPGRPVPLPASVLTRAWGRVDVPPVEWWAGPVDVVHGTNFVVPPSRRAARLVTVHDLTPVRFPELCSPAALRYPGLVRRAVAGGAHVHAVSATVAAEVVEWLGVDSGVVHVVANGIAAPPPVAPAAGPPYVLGLGTVEPRKNFPVLVAAFDRMARSHPDARLVIAGPPGWGSEALEQALGAARHRDRIDVLGWTTDPSGLVAGAAVLAYPSLYEGFGLPPLEAMALGVPVVASTAGALPEVLGSAALLVDPGDTEALAAALATALTDGAERDRLVAAGRARSALFPLSATGAGLAGLYRHLAG